MENARRLKIIITINEWIPFVLFNKNSITIVVTGKITTVNKILIEKTVGKGRTGNE